jgi:hypothetical protein
VEAVHVSLSATNVALTVVELDRHAVHQQAVLRAVAHDEVRSLKPRQFSERIVQGLGRQRRFTRASA